MTLSFFFNDPATTDIYTLSLPDALPLPRPCPPHGTARGRRRPPQPASAFDASQRRATSEGGSPRISTLAFIDRKSTRLNSSHANISYAVFCLKKKTSAVELAHASDMVHA